MVYGKGRRIMELNYNEELDKNGLDLKVHIDFIRNKENPDKMEVLQCSISKGYECIDYAFTLEQTTLADLIKEFVKHE